MLPHIQIQRISLEGKAVESKERVELRLLEERRSRSFIDVPVRGSSSLELGPHLILGCIICSDSQARRLGIPNSPTGMNYWNGMPWKLFN